MADPIVLVVDDDRNVRETIRDFLELEGVPVRAVGPEEDIPGIVAADPIGVVVTDLNMGSLDGMDLARALKALAADLGRELPVFVLTGAGGEARLRGEDAEAAIAGWFPKPPDLDDFLDRIREALARVGEIEA